MVAIGRPGLHFHDLRHTGNTIAADTGASLRDLMARMGHDSPRAALIYQHASREADQAIATGDGRGGQDGSAPRLPGAGKRPESRRDDGR